MSKIYLKAKNKKSGNQSIEFEGADISVVRPPCSSRRADADFGFCLGAAPPAGLVRRAGSSASRAARRPPPRQCHADDVHCLSPHRGVLARIG